MDARPIALNPHRMRRGSMLLEALAAISLLVVFVIYQYKVTSNSSAMIGAAANDIACLAWLDNFAALIVAADIAPDGDLTLSPELSQGITFAATPSTYNNVGIGFGDANNPRLRGTVTTARTQLENADELLQVFRYDVTLVSADFDIGNGVTDNVTLSRSIFRTVSPP